MDDGESNAVVEPFPISADDPLAEVHAEVASWVEAASVGPMGCFEDVSLKKLPSGRNLFYAGREQAVRYVVAAAIQASYWERLANQFRSRAESIFEQINVRWDPGWQEFASRNRQAGAIIRALMRRTLPFEKDHLLTILNWCNVVEPLSVNSAPLGVVAKALENYAKQTPLDFDLTSAMKRYSLQLHASDYKEAKRLGAIVDQLCNVVDVDLPTDEETAILPPPNPASAGCEATLDQLKRHLGMVPSEPVPVTRTIGPDRFPMRDDSPLRWEHLLLTDFLNEVGSTEDYSYPHFEQIPAGRALLELAPTVAGRALLASLERYFNSWHVLADEIAEGVWQSRHALAAAASRLFDQPRNLSREGLFDLLLGLAMNHLHTTPMRRDRVGNLINEIEYHVAARPATEGERFVLALFRGSLLDGLELGKPCEEVRRLSRIIHDGAQYYLVSGEVWSDAVNNDLAKQNPVRRRSWTALLTHALSATSARPTSKWVNTAKELIKPIGSATVQRMLRRWLTLFPKGDSLPTIGDYRIGARGLAGMIDNDNATCLRGLLWMIPLLPKRHDLMRDVTAVALFAYKKMPGVGPRAVKVGNAAVYVLAELATTDAVGQLGMLKARVKFGTAQNEIEKAFSAAAEKLGLPRDQIEEMGVPSYGVEDGGVRRESFGDYRAELLVTGSTAAIRWFDGQDKSLKSVPAKVKADHPDELKEIQQALKDVQSMLPAQRDRLDSLFLAQKSWPLEVWRERYLEHPLIGTIARRLLWCIDGDAAIFLKDGPVDASGRSIDLGKAPEITLWHPVERPAAEIAAWRQRIESLAIVQPFKQAHREVYPLTDAERNTVSYSNRFAAHVLRQHQFNALCAVRGWKSQLRLNVDDTYAPPFKDLPQWGLRAEFWVESIGGDDGSDTNATGVYLYLASDQVRFYRIRAAPNEVHAGGGGYNSRAFGPGPDNFNEPLPLDQIPPLVFSEVMRDVDLFVGVASVGNDPRWQDGGPQGRYREYWSNYSFGELSGTAATRKDVLERLIPRLKIAGQCSFSDRFLIVQGQKRAYKIHLGSGNILMEPNDQYLCIVPDARAALQQPDLFVPFEGDNTLSIIISKALLLADDQRIKDPTITRQIDR